MSVRRVRKLRRRRRVIWDRRGLPARRLSAERGGRGFGQALYWAARNGICVITRAGKLAAVLLGPAGDPKPPKGIKNITPITAARRRDPDGIFILADQIFGSRHDTDKWMVLWIWGRAGIRPVDKLGTPEGVEEIRGFLHALQRGSFA